MGQDAIKLPVLGWELPRPKKWDIVALLVLVVSILAAGLNLRAALGGAPGESMASWLTGAVVVPSCTQTRSRMRHSPSRFS